MAYKLLVLFLTALLTSPSFSAEANLSWTEPTQNEDGSPLTDLTSYEIHYGCTQSGVYGSVEYLSAPATAYTVLGLPDNGVCYFAAKAVNSQSIASVYSNEATRVFGSLEVPGVVTDTTITWQESVGMGFTYTGGATNAGDNSSPTTGIHGISISSGDLVVLEVHSNSTTTISDDGNGSGSLFTLEGSNTPYSNRTTVLWKIANSTEPTQYDFTAANADWRVTIKVFPNAGNVVIDSALVYDKDSVSTAEFFTIDAAAGRVVSAGAVSIIIGLTDDRQSSEDYTVASDSYVSAVGNTSRQASAMAHRIWATGGTDVAATIKTADGADGMDFENSSWHISFVESAAASGAVASLSLLHRNQMRHMLNR